MKGKLSVSKEQVLEIEHYCQQHGVPRRQRLHELGLSRGCFYYTRSLLSSSVPQAGRFLPICQGTVIRHATQSGETPRPAIGQPRPMSVEVRLSSGTEIRMSGDISPEILIAVIANV